MPDKPRIPPPVDLLDEPALVELHSARLAPGSTVMWDTFMEDGTFLRDRRELVNGGRYKIYDATRFLEVHFEREDGRGGLQIRRIPWAHIAHVTPIADG